MYIFRFSYFWARRCADNWNSKCTLKSKTTTNCQLNFHFPQLFLDSLFNICQLLLQFLFIYIITRLVDYLTLECPAWSGKSVSDSALLLKPLRFNIAILAVTWMLGMSNCRLTVNGESWPELTKVLQLNVDRFYLACKTCLNFSTRIFL